MDENTRDLPEVRGLLDPDFDVDPDPLDASRTKWYCPWCLEEFDYEEQLDAHEHDCEAYLPWKGGQ